MTVIGLGGERVPILLPFLQLPLRADPVRRETGSRREDLLRELRVNAQ